MKQLPGFLLIASLGVFGACNNANQPKDSVDSAKQINNQNDTNKMYPSSDTANASMSNTPVDKDVAEFAVEAANGGMMEIDLGKMAQEKAASERVRNFGSMMVRDHTMLADRLKAIAKSKNIALPATTGNDAQKHMDELSKKSGSDFDKAYMSMMLDDHKKDLKTFQKNADGSKDSDIKGFAAGAVPVIQRHLDSARAITGKQ